MKSILNIIAIILVIFGIVALAYNGFTYNSPETVAQVGDAKLSVETEKRVYLSPAVGGIALAVGIVLLVINRRR